MTVGEKIRLYPTEEQEKLFWKFAGASRFTYNTCLAYKIEVFQETGYSCKIQDLTEYVRDLSYDSEEWLLQIPTSVTKQAIMDLDKAYKEFFKRGNRGFPNFKKKGRCKVSFYQRTDKFRMPDEYHIKLTGIKEPVRIHRHKIIKKVGNPRVSFDGKYWYFSYCYEIEPDPKSEKGEIIGVDLGIKNLAVCSDGRVYKNINKERFVSKLEKRLKHLQRQLSKKYEMNKDGGKYVKTKNIIKLENEIRLIHRKLGNMRDTYIHQVTYDIVKTKPYCVVIEDLNVSGMMKNKHLSKAIQQQEFYKFRQYLTYKCDLYGVNLIVAKNIFPSSKLCSCCGAKRKFLSLSERTYRCFECGNEMDRDLNASINLANYGKEELIRTSKVS